MDMSSLDSVRSAAKTVLELGQAIDVLLNNAGLMNSHRRETVDGYEETLAVNHFAPFLLTGLLLPAIKSAGSSARIVNVASGAHKFVRGMQFDDLQSENEFKMFNVYGRSKLANMLFTRSLAKRLEVGWDNRQLSASRSGLYQHRQAAWRVAGDNSCTPYLNPSFAIL